MPTIYEETFDIWQKELHNPEIQPLRNGFYRELANYIRRMKEAQRNLDPKSLKATLIQEELLRLEQIVPQLVKIRSEKLWKISGQTNSSTVSLDTPEKWVNDEIISVNRQLDKLSSEILQGHVPSETPLKPKEKLTVRFVKEVPSIIGVDLKTHGPFLKEDVAVLPYENAESLIRQGAAVEVNVSLTQQQQGNE